MITAFVQFKLPAPITREQARATFLSTTPKYKGLPGLIRKYYVLSEDGGTAGGIYLWESREAAERVYTDEWKAFVRGKYGSDPQIAFLHSPVVVDNLSGETIADD